MRKVQIILFNDGNVGRNNRLQQLFDYKGIFVVDQESKGYVDFTPQQFGVKSFPAYVFLAEVSTDYYAAQSVIQREMSDQEILNEYNRVAGLKTVVTPPASGSKYGQPGGEEGGKKGGTKGGTGTGCLLPLWLTGGKCITVPAWIWLIPAAYATVKIIDAQKTSGRLIWGAGAGYSLYQYIKGVNRK